MISWQLLSILFPTFNTGRWTAAPGQVPLTGHAVRATDVIPRLALIGQHSASDVGGVGWGDPTKLNSGEGGTGVIRLDLCRDSILVTHKCPSRPLFHCYRTSFTYRGNEWRTPDSRWNWSHQDHSETEWWPLTPRTQLGNVPWTEHIVQSH